MNQTNIIDHLNILHKNLVNNIVSKDLKDLIRDNTFFAGGCFKALLLDEKVNDYDLYFKDEKSVKMFQTILEFQGFSPNIEILVKTENAVTVQFEEKIIQFIVKFWGSPQVVTRMFDFRHCMSFYSPFDGSFQIFDHSILSKELVYNTRSPYPISTMKRVGKFIQQGWIIDDTELIKIAINISRLKLDAGEVLKEHVSMLNYSGYKAGKLDSIFEERFDKERVVRKVTKKIKGEVV